MRLLKIVLSYMNCAYWTKIGIKNCGKQASITCRFFQLFSPVLKSVSSTPVCSIILELMKSKWREVFS